MLYLIDTDTLGNLLSKRPSVRLLRRLSATSPSQQFTSTITAGELYYGIERSSQSEKLRKRLEDEVWPRVTVLSFDVKAAEVYGRLRAELERKGEPLSDPDLMIASIALANSLTLITGNTKHFKRVNELQIENWLQ